MFHTQTLFLWSLVHCAVSSAVVVLGRGLGLLTFCPPPPSFSTDYLLLPLPTWRSGALPPGVFWLEPPLFVCRQLLYIYYYAEAANSG